MRFNDARSFAIFIKTTVFFYLHPLSELGWVKLLSNRGWSRANEKRKWQIINGCLSVSGLQLLYWDSESIEKAGKVSQIIQSGVSSPSPQGTAIQLGFLSHQVVKASSWDPSFLGESVFCLVGQRSRVGLDTPDLSHFLKPTFPENLLRDIMLP